MKEMFLNEFGNVELKESNTEKIEINIPYFMLEGNNAKKIEIVEEPKIHKEKNSRNISTKNKREYSQREKALFDRAKIERARKIRKIKLTVKTIFYSVEFAMLYVCFYLGGLMENPYTLNSSRVSSALIQAIFALACIILIERSWPSFKKDFKKFFR